MPRIEKAVNQLHSLSPREKEAACLLARGHSNLEIATLLNISVNTVKFHLKNIFDKTGVGSRSALMARINDIVIN
ncbi:MAG TPA: helix-turn-helix transcriptional regulator, partial [bacterium]|nr:helix-turn-helix transcriptional regulator [bacterium]